MANADATFLPIFTPGRPGPPEKIGGHEASGYHAIGVKDHPGSKAVLIPINLGKLYYIHGYEQHKNILLDILDHIAPETKALVNTNAPERVEIIVQQFIRNTPSNLAKNEPEGLIVHLINLTGFSNSYFDPLPVENIEMDVACPVEPQRIFSMVAQKQIPFDWQNGRVKFNLAVLNEFDGLVIEF